MPGPWFATKAEYWEGEWYGTLSNKYGDDVWTVSTDPAAVGWNTDGGTSGYGISEADARLMAAAPDLLAVCQALIANFDSGNAGAYDGFEIPAARAAIKKALEPPE